MIIYDTLLDGTHPEIHKIDDMFKRRTDGWLRVTPKITENLRKLWVVLEKEVKERERYLFLEYGDSVVYLLLFLCTC